MKDQQILGASGNQNKSVRDGSKLPSEESWSGFTWDISETLSATPSSRIGMKRLQSGCVLSKDLPPIQKQHGLSLCVLNAPLSSMIPFSEGLALSHSLE